MKNMSKIITLTIIAYSLYSCTAMAMEPRKPAPEVPKKTYKAPKVPKKTYKTIGKDKIINQFSQTSCPICKKNFTNQDTNLVRLSCGHVFHENCIDNWFGTVGGIDKQTGSVTWQETNRRCPVCKIDVRGKYETEKMEKLFAQEAKKSGISIKPQMPRKKVRETKDYIFYLDENGIERVQHK